MHGLLLDVFESPTMETELARTLDVTRMNMVPLGLGDMSWFTTHNISGEHKSIDQVMNEMGKRLDEQLRKHCEHADEVFLAVDGLVTPVPGERACYLWEQSKNGAGFFRANNWKTLQPRKINHAWEDLAAYYYSLWANYGIMTVSAPTTAMLCLTISAMVHNSHKPEHNTLNSYVKHQPVTFEDDPYIKTWMGLSGGLIGEVTAKQLRDTYGTPYNSFIQSKGTWKLPPALFDRIMKAIGRSV